MRRIIALIIAGILLQASFISAFAYTISLEDGTIIGEDTETEVTPSAPEEILPETEYEKWDILEMFYSLGITDEETISYASLDKPLTKGLFVWLLGNIYFYEQGKMLASEDKFSDVGINHYASAYIEQFVGLGIINGNGNGEFEDQKNISLDEAYKLAVGALGYGKLLEGGVWPDIYRKTASELDIIVSVNNIDEITRREALKLLYNMLETDVCEQSFSEDNIYLGTGNTFMYERMGIQKNRGVLLTYEENSVAGGSAGEKIAVFNNLSLTDKTGIAGEYLGYNTEYYYNYEKEILLFITDYKSESLTVNSEDIKPGYSNNTLSYYVDGKTKSVKIESDASFVYNGRAAKDLSAFPPSYGEVELVNNDSDSAYEVVMVSDYVVYYLSATDADRDELFLKNASGSRIIEMAEYSDYDIVSADGTELADTSLRAGQVIMVQEADNYVRLTVCTDALTGTVSGISDEDKYVVDGVEIKKTPSFYTESWDGKNLGVIATFYLDKFGNAVMASRGQSTSEWRMHFLVRATYDDDIEQGFVGMINEFGDKKNYQLAEKVRIDGVRCDAEIAVTALSENTIIRYLIDENGLVTALDTPMDKSYFANLDGKDDDNEYDCLYKRVGGTALTVNALSRLVPSTSRNTTVEANVYGNSSTLYYSLPARADVPLMEEDDIYSVASGFYANDVVVDIDSYAVGNNMYAGVIVSFGYGRSATAKISNNSAPMLVKDVVKCVNEEEDVVYKVTGMHEGAERTYEVSDRLEYGEEDYFIKDFATVSPGDVIRFNLDPNNKIELGIKEYSSDGLGRVNEACYDTADLMGMNRIIRARILFREGGVIAYQAEDGSLDPALQTLGGTMKIFVYDRSARKKNAITVGTYEDIQLAIDSPESYETVLIGSYHTEGRNMFLIKK